MPFCGGNRKKVVAFAMGLALLVVSSTAAVRHHDPHRGRAIAVHSVKRLATEAPTSTDVAPPPPSFELPRSSSATGRDAGADALGVSVPKSRRNRVLGGMGRYGPG